MTKICPEIPAVTVHNPKQTSPKLILALWDGLQIVQRLEQSLEKKFSIIKSKAWLDIKFRIEQLGSAESTVADLRRTYYEWKNENNKTIQDKSNQSVLSTPRVLSVFKTQSKNHFLSIEEILIPDLPKTVTGMSYTLQP